MFSVSNGLGSARVDEDACTAAAVFHANGRSANPGFLAWTYFKNHIRPLETRFRSGKSLISPG